MASIGDQLRQAREAQGLSVAEVVDQTKMKTDQVHALEEGNWDVFPAPVYLRGFVRNYASLLKLDTEALVRDMEVEIGQTKSEVTGEDGKAPLRAGFLDGAMLCFSGVKWGAVVPIFFVVILALGAYFGTEEWRKYKSRDPLERLGSGINEGVLDAAGDQLPVELPDSSPSRSQ